MKRISRLRSNTRAVLLSVLAMCILFYGFLSWGLVDLVGAEGARPEPSPYAVDVKPLKPEQCGRCHKHYFDLIKDKGGKHRIDCTECHVEFHVYRPGKTEYEAIMPKCASCHDEVHGPDLAECVACHNEPHAPKDIPAVRWLEKGCPVCHPEADKEMKTYITQHTELYCTSCHHSKHKTVPECLECHQPHEEGTTQAECLACHPPHSAMQVVYGADISQEACRGCHRQTYDVLKRSNTKHRVLLCAKCHPKHRAIIQCSECHAKPHAEAMLRDFKVCGDCHGMAHSLIK